MQSADIEELKILWMSQQDELKSDLIVIDCEPWQSKRDLKLVGGMDLSFSKSNEHIAYCTIVVCSIPSLEVVYEESQLVELKTPYAAGFLAFREVKPCLDLYSKLVRLQPDMIPQVVLFDGNGILHPRGLGLASHFGVLANVCTIGVAKNLHSMDGFFHRDEQHLAKIQALVAPGDFFPLQNAKDEILGVALKTGRNAKRPVYVSIGHRISLDTAIWTVQKCVKNYRIPEPTRQADIRSRIAVRDRMTIG